MIFEAPLQPARQVKRYKRFLADVELPDGRVVVAHCANSGSMQGCDAPGSAVMLSANTNPKAKLDWRWEMVEVDGFWVGINTSHPNRIVAEAISGGMIAGLQGYGSLRREVQYGRNSRIDILLENGAAGQGLCYVEVKNVTLKVGDEARFPDAVTARGAKHLQELIHMVAQGHRAVMLFLVQRGDCACFRPAADIDPHYASMLARARAAGVEILCYSCDLSPTEIAVCGTLPIDLQTA